MTTVRIWARKWEERTNAVGGKYMETVQANDRHCSIVTRDNASAFAMKREINR